MKPGVLHFLIFSLLGFGLFVIPFSFYTPQSLQDGSYILQNNVFLGHFKGYIFYFAGTGVLYFSIAIAVLALLGTLVQILSPFKNPFFKHLFHGDPLQHLMRILGFSLYLYIVFDGKGVIGETDFFANTVDVMSGNIHTAGGDLGGFLIQSLFVTFCAGILLLPLLTKFGLVEFLGTLIAPFMKKVFKVPGYAAVDALASFVGDGTVGIILTDQQYQNGYYTQRQAATIAASFSIVGISFALVVADLLGLNAIFGFFYLSIGVVTFVLAVIIARLPLKKFKDTYYKAPVEVKEKNESDSVWNYALDLAAQKASKEKFFVAFRDSIWQLMGFYFNFIPIILFVGTCGLILAEYTPFFTWIAAPFVPVLEFFGFAQEISTQMAPAMLVGFADMYLPAIFAKSIELPLAKFVVGVLAFTQLVFLSETGMILYKSKIGFGFLDLIKLFLFRTMISLPLVMGLGYLGKWLGFL